MSDNPKAPAFDDLIDLRAERRAAHRAEGAPGGGDDLVVGLDAGRRTGRDRAAGPDDRRVLVTTRSFGSGSVDVVRLLESTGIDVVRASGRHDPVELVEVLPGVQAWITGRAPVTAELLDLAP